MFERFTEHARDVFSLASQEAQRFGNPYLGTEHILWGLAKEVQGVAAAVLEQCGVDLKPLRQEVDALLQDRPHVEAIEALPPSEHAKQALQFAIDEARQMHHTHVGTEHLLLGLLRDGGTVAAAVLANLGLERELVRDEVRKVAGAAHD
jgi:ATP-dependent Clp protease ATP-binding subunit ClpC